MFIAPAAALTALPALAADVPAYTASVPAIFGAGLIGSWALIVAIGPQNAAVLRQGLTGRHVLPVVLICALSDFVLIGLGVLGIGAAVTAAPWLLQWARWLGAAFLIWYGCMSLWRARRPGTLDVEGRAPSSLRGAVLTILALTYLNPHVYLDTMLFLGTLANQYGTQGRWVFWAGAFCASASWFFGLGFGAAKLRPLFARPRSWQILDLAIGVLMLFLAANLLTGA